MDDPTLDPSKSTPSADPRGPAEAAPPIAAPAAAAPAEDAAATEATAPPEAAPEPDPHAAEPEVPPVAVADAGGLQGATALLWSAAIVAASQAGAMVTRRPAGASARTWATVEVYVAGHVIAMALAAAAGVLAWRQIAPRSRLAGYLVIAGIALPFGQITLRDDLAGAAQKLEDSTRLLVAVGQPLLVAIVALSLPFALALGRASARPWARWAAVLAAAAIGAAGAVLQPQGYEGLHLLTTLIACALGAAAIAGARPPDRALRWPRWVGRGAVAIAAALAIGSVAVWPPNAVVVLLGAEPAAVLVPHLARVHLRLAATRVVPPAQKEWFSDRSALPPRPPTQPDRPPADLVLLIGIDSVRAALLADEAQRERLPELFRLRDEGVWFTEARSAGASTAPALASLFSSLYYSQLHWTTHPKRSTEVFPHLDPSPRFPELLGAAGVRTVSIDTTGWLTNEFGIVRGFKIEEGARKGRGYPAADVVLGALNRRLGRAPSRTFGFAHLLDPHSPYQSAGRFATPYEGYLAEIALVDKAIGRFRAKLETEGTWARTTLLVFSDHGEAFGEHGTTWHGSTVYDELLRVPLLIVSPDLTPRLVAAPVSLVDLGPTILDLMGVATPGRMMGQSLVGLARGEGAPPTRPIVAEARLKRAMVLSNGLKIVQDSRKLGVELYDLARDAKEEHNVFDDVPDGRKSLGVLGAFFDEHTLRRPGYEVPYRKW